MDCPFYVFQAPRPSSGVGQTRPVLGPVLVSGGGHRGGRRTVAVVPALRPAGIEQDPLCRRGPAGPHLSQRSHPPGRLLRHLRRPVLPSEPGAEAGNFEGLPHRSFCHYLLLSVPADVLRRLDRGGMHRPDRARIGPGAGAVPEPVGPLCRIPAQCQGERSAGHLHPAHGRLEGAGGIEPMGGGLRRGNAPSGPGGGSGEPHRRGRGWPVLCGHVPAAVRGHYRRFGGVLL